MVEIGRLNICCEVSMISLHLALHKKGHMAKVFHIFVYLKKHHNTRLMFDPSYPAINPDTFQHHDWTKIYDNVKKIIPLDMPKPLGKEVIMHYFIDAYHVGKILTRRSRIYFIIFLQMAPIYYFSKHQNSLETSTFGSEFMATKHATEEIRRFL